MKVFLGIKHFDDSRNRQLIEDISSLLTSKGFETISITRDIEKWGKLNLSPQELMFETFEALNSCDIVLIELSVKGVGLGIEAGYAFARNKPIIIIANRKASISKSLEGISTATFIYDSLADLDRLFDGLDDINKQPKAAFLDKQPNLDLLLVNTPQFDYSVVPFRSYASLPPLGLAYIATWLISRGFSVELLDGEYRGLSPKAIAGIANEKKPRFLGINLLTPTYHIAASILYIAS